MNEATYLSLLATVPEDFDAIAVAENLFGVRPSNRSISGRDLGFLCAALLLLQRQEAAPQEPAISKPVAPSPVAQPVADKPVANSPTARVPTALSPVLLPTIRSVIARYRDYENSQFSRGEAGAQRKLASEITKLENQIREEYPYACS